MPTVLDEREVKARKPHRCGLCGGKIEIGTTHTVQTIAGEDTPYRFREHTHCGRISHAIWDYADPDNGMTEDDFRDAVESLMSQFYCLYHCSAYDKDQGSCEDKGPMDCLEKFDAYLMTHKLELVREKYGFAWKMTEVKPNGDKKEEGTA